MDPPCLRARFVALRMIEHKGVVHTLMNVKIVPVDDSELLGSPLIAGAVRRITNDKHKGVVHSLMNVKIVPVDDSELLGSPMFAGAFRRITNDKT